MSSHYWRFVIATAIGIAPGVIMNLIAAKNDPSIGAGLAILFLPPLVHAIAGWTCPPAGAREDPHITANIILGTLSVCLPTFLVLNAPSDNEIAVVISTISVVGLGFFGAKIGLAARAGV